MGLRAKPPILEPNRFRAVIFGDKGVGKTHFCLSMPNVYYIDTEGATKYKQFYDMLKQNNSVEIKLYDLQEIIKEVTDLLSLKHNYKTLVIDSISVPCAALANLEVERLVKQSKLPIEGTEFGANLAKVKRLTFQLGILLARLDMNVIVTAHEKSKYRANVEIGREPDVNEKLSYCLGSEVHLELRAGKRKATFKKTRYSEFKTLETIDFDDGYNVLKERLGEEIFLRDSVSEVLASKEQILELNRLIEILNYPQEKVQKWLSASQSSSFDEMKSELINKCIEFLKSHVTGE